jgi:hypothetical protein
VTGGFSHGSCFKIFSRVLDRGGTKKNTKGDFETASKHHLPFGTFSILV